MPDGKNIDLYYLLKGYNFMEKSNYLKNIFYLAIGGVFISFSPIFVKLIDTELMGPTAIGFWRMFIGGLFLLLFAIIRGESLNMPKPVFYFALLAGLLFYGDIFVWHRSIIFVGAGISTILGNTQVFWMALFGVIIFKEKLPFYFLLALVGSFVGVTLLVGIGSDLSFTDTYIKGIIYGLLTGFFYSTFMISIIKADSYSENNNFFTFIAWTSIICSVFLAISTVLEKDILWPSGLNVWLPLFGLGIVIQSLGWWIITANLPKVRAAQGGMILLLQPTLATIWGAILFSERLSVLQLFGAAITLTAIYVGSVSLSKYKKRV